MYIASNRRSPAESREDNGVASEAFGTTGILATCLMARWHV
jgi:hypothetical protein